MADSVYRVLLALLPGWFREEFSAEMRLVFADSRKHAAGPAVVGLWFSTVRDVTTLAWRLHVDALKQGGLVTSAVGVVIGAVASLAITKSLGAFLYEVSPRDPITIVATAVLLLAIAGMATYLPARRALAANPAEVLRAQ